MKPYITIWKLEDKNASTLIDMLFDRVEKLEEEVKELRQHKNPLMKLGHLANYRWAQGDDAS